MKIIISNLGQIDYEKALAIQEKLLKLRQQDEVENTLLLLEHPPTLTLGLKANRSNIIVPPEVLEKQGVKVHKVNRGGDVTYHGPGQIVGYPIIKLNGDDRNIREFFRKTEEVFIQLLEMEYGIIARRFSEYPGVWIENEKITAIGVAFKRWVSMHGFAFNVSTNLEHFKLINPCGITDKGITSLEKVLGQPQDFNKVNELVIEYFCKVFNLEPEKMDQRKLLEKIGVEI